MTIDTLNLGSKMGDPCQFQATIIKHGEEIARNTQSLETLAPNIEKISANVELLTTKLSGMKGFIAGAAACSGAIVGLIVWIAKFIPVAAMSIIK